MTVGSWGALLAGTGLLAACASVPDMESLTAGQREKVGSMAVLFGPTESEGIVLGQVKGRGCHKDPRQPRLDAMHEALRNLKIEAVLLDADAVIHAACGEVMVDWSASCWRLIDCSGDAFRYGER